MRALGPMVLALAVWKLVEIGMFVAAPEPSRSWLVAIVFSMVAAIVAYLAVELVLLGLDWEQLGLPLRRAWRGIAAGLGVGGALFGVVIVIYWLAGWYEPTELLEPVPRSFAGAAFGITFAAVAEEFVFRGMILRRTTIALGPALGIAISSVAFGIAHLGAAHGLVDAAVVGIGGGCLFGAAYLATGSLWLPIGLHAGWNLSQALLVGFPADAGVGTDVVRATQAGPHWLVGTPGSPETGAVVLVVCISVAFLTIRRYAGVAPGHAN
jgi:membrane protease YdiL (CAAX protease family)